jgi:predicted  nucleic acid-binding Zn-ribbon protein
MGMSRHEQNTGIPGASVGVSQLYELQQVDTALARAISYRQSLDEGVAARAALMEATMRLESLERQRAACQSRLRVLDLEVQSLQAKRSRVNADLYSGRVGNPKELAAMQEEVSVFDRQKAGLEDEELTLLEQVEQLDAQVRQTEQATEAARAALAQQEALFRQAASAADQEISDLTARRQVLTADVGEDLIRRYERLREHKGGLAVVAVRGGICDGCHVVVPERLITRLQKDPDLIAACDGCGRLLVVQ